jgi:hypothetical protein
VGHAGTAVEQHERRSASVKVTANLEPGLMPSKGEKVVDGRRRGHQVRVAVTMIPAV